MSQSLAKIVAHVIFSTKDRRSLITPDVREKLHAYLAGILKRLECTPILVGGTDDHVHILCCLCRTLAIADILEEVKSGSSKWIKTKSPTLEDFHWQNGYGAFSVSQSNVAEVKAYIAGQEAHHRKMTFQEEFEAFLKRHRVDYDPKYVWD